MPARPARKRISPSRTSRPSASRWKVYAMMGIIGAVLVSGFFFAARQHFLSWDYGMKNSRLRKQIDELETEKRRLMLARENSSSPSEVKRVARKMGLSDSSQMSQSRPELASAVVPSRPSPTERRPDSPSGKVERTVDTKPTTYSVVPATLKVLAAKPMRSVRETRRETAE